MVTFCLIILYASINPPSLDKSGEWGLGYAVIFWWGLTIPFSFFGAVGAKLAPENLPLSVMTQIGVAGGLFYVFINLPPLNELAWSWVLLSLSIIVFILSGLLTLVKGVLKSI